MSFDLGSASKTQQKQTKTNTSTEGAKSAGVETTALGVIQNQIGNQGMMDLLSSSSSSDSSQEGVVQNKFSDLIQRQEDQMKNHNMQKIDNQPFNIIQKVASFSSGSSDDIKEYEYAEASSIQFSSMTSCVGIAGIKGDKVKGLHIGQVIGSDFITQEDAVAINTFAKSYMSGCSDITLFGCLDCWGGIGLLPTIKDGVGITNTKQIENVIKAHIGDGSLILENA